MRAFRGIVLVVVCLLIASPALAVDQEREGGLWKAASSTWETLIEWVAVKVGVPAAATMLAGPTQDTGNGTEPNGLESSAAVDPSEIGSELEPNG